MSMLKPHPTRLPRRLLAACLLLPLLAGCSSLLGGGGDRERATIYAPDPRVQADPAWPRADWQLTLSPPTAARMIDSFRIAVRPTPSELQVYRGASWAKTPTDMLQDTVLRTLEERDIRFVRLWFTDVLGFLKSVAVAPAELEAAENAYRAKQIGIARAIFARGAIRAAIWGQDKGPGEYDMQDVLGLN